MRLGIWSVSLAYNVVDTPPTRKLPIRFHSDCIRCYTSTCNEAGGAGESSCPLVSTDARKGRSDSTKTQAWRNWFRIYSVPCKMLSPSLRALSTSSTASSGTTISLYSSIWSYKGKKHDTWRPPLYHILRIMVVEYENKRTRSTAPNASAANKAFATSAQAPYTGRRGNVVWVCTNCKCLKQHYYIQRVALKIISPKNARRYRREAVLVR